MADAGDAKVEMLKLKQQVLSAAARGIGRLTTRAQREAEAIH